MEAVLSDAARAHLRWALTDGVGPLTFGRLIERFGDAERALTARVSELSEIERVGSQKADRIARSRDAVELDAEIAACAQHGVRIICRADPLYPPGLRQMPDAPIVLFVRGDLLPTDAVAVAVVGSRRCSIYGSEQARRFGELLASAGFTVVSGLARGIDSFAHHGAIAGGGRTLAVMGRGLDGVYPPENNALAEQILSHGAWLSELPIHSSVRAENFPSRNRIIAGLSLGTLVIEAAQRSGALITARLANEYNREVFALPGRAQDATSAGTNNLIRSGGAKLVTCLDDILDELGSIAAALQPGGTTTPGAAPPRTQPAPPGLFDLPAARADDADRDDAPTELDATLARVFDAVGTEPTLAEAVINKSALPVGQVLGALTALELRGLIRRLPGNQVMRRTAPTGDAR